MSFSETGKKSRRSRSVETTLYRLFIEKIGKAGLAHQNKNWQEVLLFSDSKIYHLYNDL